MSSQQWQFDALGNWKTFTKDGTPETRIANAQNEYTSVGGTSLGYSANGNLVTDEQGRTFEYDAWNRLVISRSSDGVLLASYDYDGLNRRITEQVSSDGISDASMSPVKDMFYSSQWQVLEERLRVAGAVGTVVEARFVWSPVYIDAMVLRDRGAERVYALQDGNWNTTALIAATGVPGKASGEVIQRMVYNPYGEVFRLNADWTEQLGAPLVAWQHLFQGLKFTEVTGLGYVRNRDYSPSLGRFIELDPIGFDAGDNNWYRFVGNGPVGRVDPWGLAGPYPPPLTIPGLLWRWAKPYFSFVGWGSIAAARMAVDTAFTLCPTITSCLPSCISCCDNTFAAGKITLLAETAAVALSCVQWSLRFPPPWNLWASAGCGAVSVFFFGIEFMNMKDDYQDCITGCRQADTQRHLG